MDNVERLAALEAEVLRLTTLGLELRGACLMLLDGRDSDGTKARLLLSTITLTPPDSIARELFNRSCVKDAKPSPVGHAQ